MLSAPLYVSTDLGNGCWGTRALLQGNEGVRQEFLIPQLDEDDQEGRIHFQQDGKKARCKSDARDAT